MRVVPTDTHFPIFRVEAWEGDVSKGMVSRMEEQVFDKATRSPIGPVRTSVLTGCTVAHRRERIPGEFVDVTSSRPEADERIEWSWLVSNILIRVMRDERQAEDPASPTRPGPPADAWEDRTRTVLRDIDDGRIPTTRVIVGVDGAPVEFHAVSLGPCSAAVAILDEVTIQMWGRLVPFDGLSLVSDYIYQDT